MSQQGNYISANNINTFYLEEGQGTPVILIHGGGAGANGWGNWHRCIPIFAKEFRVLVPDMVGFGQTEKPDPANFTYSQDARVDHVIGFIEALGLKDVALIGNSMGGATSMGVCMKRPELVSKLILMGGAGLNAEITDALKPVLNYDFTPEGMIRLIKVLANKNFEILEDMVQYRWKNSIDEGARKAYAATMEWVRQQGGLYYPEDQIASIKTNTLVVNGKEDLVVPLQYAYRFLELLENSWGYIVPHCGHWAMIEYPEDFSHACMNFILHA